MTFADRAKPYLDDLLAIRHDLHAHPELAFQETRTAGIVAQTLRDYGVDEVHTGIGRTGVVGVVRAGSGQGGASNRAMALRADMDALPITETGTVPHRSKTEGRMHACGHDGHTTMLLGAARYLAEHRDFDGTVYLIFQPAEEAGGGGRVMIQDGLFKRFDCQSVWGMHNLPGMPVGAIGTRSGPFLAATDAFSITVRGVTGHPAMPHLTRDPVLTAAHIVTALQTIVSRRADPVHAAVVTVAKVAAGDVIDVIPQSAKLTGTCRTFTPQMRDMVEADLRRIAERTADAFGTTADIRYGRGYPACVNSPAETQIAAAAARAVVGAAGHVDNVAPLMGGEDFAYMLEARPGSFIALGNGMPGERGGTMLHAPDYDFNDAAIPYGVGYWTALVEAVLPKPA